MIINQKQFMTGLIMLIFFFIVFALIMSPVLNGKTVIQTADDLFNSLTKGSTYYIPKAQKSATGFDGKTFDVSLTLNSNEEVDKIGKVLGMAGAMVEAGENKVNISGDLGKMTRFALADADAVFKGENAGLTGRYGFADKEALYYWWLVFKELNNKYKLEGKSAEMSFVNTVQTKTLEVAYNFEGIQADKVADRAGITTFMLVFYVAYTVWYGFAIMFIMEGLGIIATAHGEKVEA
ncbi:MAG: hypothetical protein C4589_07115 [Peptococcaceae bacterium]|nr:MAG: hypothetical protein C4589_07115 [Peptococcaceae bacterium]